jgi:hypothetical protein
MQFSYDRTGFPMVRLPALALDVHLLPVTKVQFEQYLAEPDGVGDGWYEAVLAAGPRASCFRFADEERERLFLTGILAHEARAFARWLGPDYDLPTVDQWRAIHQTLKGMPATVPPPCRDASRWQARKCGAILKALRRRLRPEDMLQFSLMEGGLVEWVRVEKDYVGLGCPRPDFFPSLYNPLVDTIRPIHPDQRLPYFGFRAVRQLG